MKKMLSLLGVGFLGLSSLQGCMSAVGDGSEEVGSAAADVVNQACYSNSGVQPTKAAIAVAMATELGRWEPAKDLVAVRPASMPMNTQPAVQLSPSAVCKPGTNNCANLRALLGQQDWRMYTFVDQNLFNAVNFNGELTQSLGRHNQNISDLTRNSPSKLPPAHKLTLVGGPVVLGPGSCGPHYVYQADRPDGTPLNATEAANLANDLVMFGYGNAGGNNPFIKYVITGQGCPAGRTCVAIDPTDGDNGSGTTTTAGSIPTYPLNRLYDQTNSKLNTQCLTTGNKLGKMLSKCATTPSTCGYLYCIAP
jgi:hypothetical protein